MRLQRRGLARRLTGVASAGWILALALAGLSCPAQEQTPVFKSDVNLVRVDVRVAARDQQPVLGLGERDFVLRDNGSQQVIRGFAAEEMPLDVLFLIDVSVSMRPHAQRLASASRQALRSLARGDRGAVMVFDRRSRLRLPFTNSLEQVEGDLEALARDEGFNGGTDITRAMLDAARYMQAAGRREARRAIIILTDDQTERDRDEHRVLRALEDADTVLSALLAPDALHTGGRGPGVPSWPDIVIFGRRRYPGGAPARARTQSAGTAEIARSSGGDSLPVDEARALQDTLDNLRQRYSLFFSLPAGAKPGERRRLSVALSADAARRYPSAMLSYRPDYAVPGGFSPQSGITGETTQSADAPQAPEAQLPAPDSGAPAPRRRSAGEVYGSRGPDPRLGVPAPGDAGSPPAPETAKPLEQSGGWRSATPADYEQAKPVENKKKKK